MSRRLDAVKNRELWVLTAGEKARVLAAEAAAGVQIHRGRSSAGSSSKADRVWETAARRIEAEEAAQAKAEAEKQAVKAKAKAVRKGWW